MKPYIDHESTDEYIIREFGQNIDPIELMWHRDNEQRIIEILESGNGWMFQYEDQLPQPLTKNTKLIINRHNWHRVIKGNENLLIKIHK